MWGLGDWGFEEKGGGNHFLRERGGLRGLNEMGWNGEDLAGGGEG